MVLHVHYTLSQIQAEVFKKYLARNQDRKTLHSDRCTPVLEKNNTIINGWPAGRTALLEECHENLTKVD